MKNTWGKSDKDGCIGGGGGGRNRRLKRRWMDSVNVDLREKGLLGEEIQNRVDAAEEEEATT